MPDQRQDSEPQPCQYFADSANGCGSAWPSGRARIETKSAAVNAALTTLYWQIGTHIRIDLLKEKRAEYGDESASALGGQLEAEFGRGFSSKNLRHMVKFAEAFPDEQIVSALRRQLGWTHFRLICFYDRVDLGLVQLERCSDDRFGPVRCGRQVRRAKNSTLLHVQHRRRLWCSSGGGVRVRTVVVHMQGCEVGK